MSGGGVWWWGKVPHGMKGEGEGGCCPLSSVECRAEKFRDLILNHLVVGYKVCLQLCIRTDIKCIHDASYNILRIFGDTVPLTSPPPLTCSYSYVMIDTYILVDQYVPSC